MTGLIRPFARLLFKKQSVIPRFAIFSTLVKLAWLKRRYPQRCPVTIRLGQYRLSGPDYALLSFLIKEKFIDDEYHFEFAGKQPVIFDCGASIGVSMIYFKALYPDAKIYCFEPNPAAFALLESNVKNNQLSQVHLYETALTASGQSVILQVPDERSMINAAVHQRQTASSTINVRAIQLSEFIIKEGKADLVKIDVEGSEYDIIRELESTGVLKNGIVKQFVIEYHTAVLKEIISAEQFCGIFEQHAYGVSRYKLFPEVADSDWMIRAVAMGRKG